MNLLKFRSADYTSFSPNRQTACRRAAPNRRNQLDAGPGAPIMGIGDRHPPVPPGVPAPLRKSLNGVPTMPPSFRDSVQAIWRAGVEAVLPGRLIRQTLSFEGDPNGAAAVTVQNEKFSLPPSGKVIVVGMGKASCAMAAGTEEVLEPLVKAGASHRLGQRPRRCGHSLERGSSPRRPAGRSERTDRRRGRRVTSNRGPHQRGFRR